MAVSLTVNGVTFNYPETGDTNWGAQATTWAQAVTSGMLQKAGGDFSLTAEVDFGQNYGLKSIYFKSRSTNPASSGVIRLAQTDTIRWMNNTNTGFVTLSVSNDVLKYEGVDVLTGEITNANISNSAAIAFSKMAALTASRGVVTDGSGVITQSTALASEVAFLSGVTSAIQTQLNAKAPIDAPTFTTSVTLPGDPASALQAATKQYVDSIATGLNAKTAVRVATTTAGTLATDFENGDTVDGVVLATNDRILIKNQVSQPTNGIYTVNASGAPTRATDADTWAELVGAYVFVSEGTANAATSWVCNVAAGGTLGVTNVTFVQFSASTSYTASGNGIELSGNQFSLELDGTTLSVSGSGIKVNEIANAQIAAAAAIAVNKLAAVTASRTLVSDGSGFVSASSVTSTTLAFLDATSSVQTQLDAKTLKATLTTRGDMYYASAANTPARLAVGTSGYVLQSDGTDPVWTDRKISETYFNSTSTYAIQTTFTALTLVAVTDSVGTPVTRSTNTITFPFTGRYELILVASMDITSGSSGRNILVRLRNTTDSTTLAVSNSCWAQLEDDTMATFVLWGNVTDIAKNYEIQIASDGANASFVSHTVDTVAGSSWKLFIRRPWQ